MWVRSVVFGGTSANDRNALRYAIRQTEPGSGTRLYDAVDQVINQYFNRIEGRKAIVLFTDGVDTTSKHASYESTVRDAEELDALIYPTWSNPPRLIGDLNTPGGDNNQLFSPSTGFPAITVPMGYTRGGTLPAGLQFFGRAWSESTLLRLAYAYEQATHHRVPPKLQ